MTFTRNFNLLIASFIILFASISGMLAVFIANSIEKEELNFSLTTNISLEVGQTRTILYDVNLDNADITFLIADPNIATIEDNLVVGKAQGSTTLRATAVYNGQIKYASCNITVNPESTPNYNILISPIHGCSYNDKTLALESETASFNLVILDNRNQALDIGNVDYICSENIVVSKQLNFIIISANSEGYVTFIQDDKNLNFTLYIKKF